ncbi:hypothetical protein ACFTZB_06450 [Rhodococcus sp. NPDC057014]|uniref:hypothetical protein n=1 Tax=Rhodococcus sp. NPDC057014 TaxID=3346000 RepID=UPI00362FE874
MDNVTDTTRTETDDFRSLDRLFGTPTRHSSGNAVDNFRLDILGVSSHGDGSQLAVAASANCDIWQAAYEIAVLAERVGSEVEALPTTGVRPSLGQIRASRSS